LWKVIPKQVLATYPEGTKLSFDDTFEEFAGHEIYQRSLYYALKVINKKKQEAGFSNVVSLSVIPLPTSPVNLRVLSLGERHIEIGWDVPSLNADGSAVKLPVQFNAYRRADAQAAETRLNQSLLQEGRFKDESIELGKTYLYSVRPVVETTPGAVEGEDSPLLEVTNPDTYPPKPPTELTAIASGEGISLVWLPNTDADLAGYWVYRSGQDKKFQRLQDQLLLTASIIDKSVQKRQTYFYRVKAVDQKGNESEFSDEVSDTVE
jgi:fibronectin type 3 domain-containing protein